MATIAFLKKSRLLPRKVRSEFESEAQTGKVTLRTEILRLDSAGRARQEEIIADVLTLDRAIFEQTNEEQTRDKLAGLNSDESWVMLVYAGKKLVGYNCITTTFMCVDGRRFALWNSRSAMHPDHRGAKVVGNFSFRYFLIFKRRHPFVPVYSLITLIHPSSFRLFADRIPRMFPYTKSTLSRRERNMFEAACTKMGLKQVPNQAEFVVKDATITRTDKIERRFWARSHDPAIQFFHLYNPDYDKGRAIATFFPNSWRQMAGITWRHLRQQGIIRKVRHWFAPALRRGRPGQVQVIPALQKFSIDEVREILKQAKFRSLPPNTTLFQHGDSTEKVFFVLKGSFYLEKGLKGFEKRMEQVGSGEGIFLYQPEAGMTYHYSARSFRYAEVVEFDLETAERYIFRPQSEKEGQRLG